MITLKKKVGLLMVALFLFGAGIAALPATAHAATPTGAATDACSNRGSTYFLGFPTWYRYMELDANCDIIGPKNSDGSINWSDAVGRVALAIVEIMTRLAALISVGYIMYGGFRYITSQGEPDNAKSARQTIINALIGLVISLIATASVVFIAGQFT